MSINVITLSGNIGNDPELKETRSGGSILKWRMAGRAGFGDNEKSVWVSCSILRSKYAEAMADVLKKGMPVTICGELSIDEWEDRDGNKRTTVEVIVADMVATGAGKSSSDSHDEAKRNGYQKDEPDDDIPF